MLFTVEAHGTGSTKKKMEFHNKLFLFSEVGPQVGNYMTYR